MGRELRKWGKDDKAKVQRQKFEARSRLRRLSSKQDCGDGDWEDRIIGKEWGW